MTCKPFFAQSKGVEYFEDHSISAKATGYQDAQRISGQDTTFRNIFYSHHLKIKQLVTLGIKHSGELENTVCATSSVGAECFDLPGPDLWYSSATSRQPHPHATSVVWLQDPWCIRPREGDCQRARSENGNW